MSVVKQLKTKKQKELESLTPEVIEGILEEYQTINDKMKVLDKRKKEIAKLIKEYSNTNGVKNSTGSMYCENDKFVFGQQARKSVKLNFDRAKDFFMERKLWDRVRVIKEDINEDEVEKLVADHLMTMEDLESIVDTKVTYAVSIKEKTVQATEMPEVQVASTKKKTLKRK